MNGLTTRVSGLAARTLVLLAAMLMLVVGISHAYDRGGDNRGGRGGKYWSGGRNGGGWRQDGGGARYKNGGRTWGGGGGYVGGGQRYGGGGRTWGGGGGYVGGGTRYYGGGGGSYCGPRTYVGGTRYYGGGGYYGGGSRYCGPSYGGVRYSGGGYCAPTVVRYVGGYCYPYVPRTYISLGIGYHSSYSYPRSVYRDDRYGDDYSGVEIDVTNEPPAGCYYYDPFCGERVSNLDDYTTHVESHDHAATVDIIRQGSGDKVRTLEFVDGYWSVQK